MLRNAKRTVLIALFAHRSTKLEMREKKRSSFEYYRFSLISKAIESLKWYIERKHDRLQKVEFMQHLHRERLIRESVE